ncbi:ABC transporter permease [Calderihabitans maritimus]|uniref:Binding-protein dependent transport system inner membrane protein n=1 Tax=Calderihabitans maritimus TaxID=1246530 RepID=A0A1Z5HWF9_9FIRM|nr:ABC transporter permease [Calderihabitans maritimus]GAW93687.1 binding-protein dependent transport system inner membrane protein [Calderihabitans maritimus]
MRGRDKLWLPLVTFTVVLTVWYLLALSGRWPPALFPSPTQVVSGIWEMANSGVLWEHIGVSLLRFVAGYLAAALIGIPLGLVCGWYSRLWLALDPLVQVLRPISPIAWMPLFAIWFGIGDLPAIVIIFIAAFYPILLSTVAAVRNIDPIYLKVAQNFGAKERDILWKVVIPAAFPYITVGLHIAMGAAWVFLVAGEMLGVRSGLGFLIVDARNSIRTELVIAGMLIIGLLGLAIDRLISRVEKQVKKQWGFVPGN